MTEYEIQPAELKELMAGENAPLLLDCREPMEHEIARIEPSELIPMNTVPQNVARIEAMAETKLVVVYCHHGVRSLNTVAWLKKQGVENVISLAGGIDRWSWEVDRDVPRY